MPIGSAAGGGGANDVRAGGAYVELSARGSFEKDILRAKAGFEGALKSMTGTLAKFGGAIGVIEGLKTFAEMAMGMNKLNISLEEGQRITEQLEQSQARLRESVFERVGGKLPKPVDIVPEADRLAFLNQQVDQTEKNLAGLGQMADTARGKLQELTGGGSLFIKHLPFASDVLEMDQNEAKAELDRLEKRRDATREHLRLLREQVAAQKQLNELGHQEPWEKQTQAERFKDWHLPIREQIRELSFLTSNMHLSPADAAVARAEWEAYRKGIKNTKEELQHFREVFDRFEKAGWHKNLDDLNKQLENDILGVGLTPQQRKLEELKRSFKWQPEDGPPGHAEEMERRRKNALDNAKHQMEMLDEAERMLKPKVLESLNVKGTFGNLLAPQLGIGDTFQQQLAKDTKEIAGNGKAMLGELKVMNGNIANLEGVKFK